MGTCKYLWLPMGICEYLWVSVSIYGYLWVSVGTYGYLYLWVSVGTYGYPWAPRTAPPRLTAARRYSYCCVQGNNRQLWSSGHHLKSCRDVAFSQDGNSECGAGGGAVAGSGPR